MGHQIIFFLGTLVLVAASVLVSAMIIETFEYMMSIDDEDAQSGPGTSKHFWNLCATCRKMYQDVDVACPTCSSKGAVKCSS